MKNGGKVSRDALAAARFHAMRYSAQSIPCEPYLAADVIEQRDLLLAAAEGALEALIMYAGVDRAEQPGWFKQRHAKLYSAIATAKGA